MTIQPTTAELDAALDGIRSSPTDGGELQLIVVRPENGERRIVEFAELDPEVGVRGDNWLGRGSRSTDDGRSDPLRQLTVMSTAAVTALAVSPDRWALAGDQMYANIDLSHANLPAGSRLALGAAIIEITEAPHPGCAKFIERFGRDAMRWVNNDVGRALRLRGANARVVRGGTVSVGDRLTKLG